MSLKDDLADTERRHAARKSAAGGVELGAAILRQMEAQIASAIETELVPLRERVASLTAELAAEKEKVGQLEERAKQAEKREAQAVADKRKAEEDLRSEAAARRQDATAHREADAKLRAKPAEPAKTAVPPQPKQSAYHIDVHRGADGLITSLDMVPKG